MQVKYIPLVVKDRKAVKFTNLVQGSMSITTYETKFEELSKYAPNLGATERDNALKLKRGLKKKFRVKITPLALYTFSEVLKRALVVKADVIEETRVLP